MLSWFQDFSWEEKTQLQRFTAISIFIEQLQADSDLDDAIVGVGNLAVNVVTRDDIIQRGGASHLLSLLNRNE